MSVITTAAPRPDADALLVTEPIGRPDTELSAVPWTRRRRALRPSGFRPDVEGLRAIAVTLVVLGHANVPGFGGGFIGVDLFFVISGFLICGLMFEEIATTGRLRIGEFFARRARRILPAAALVLSASALASWLIFSPLRTMDFLRELIGAVFYAANWAFIAKQTDYMHQGAEVSPLLHFWSLAVEEQFYLVWPFVFVACAMVGRRVLVRRDPAGYVRPGGRAWTPLLVAITLVAGVASFALCVWQTKHNQPFAYMATTTRAWQFAAGAIVGIAVRVLAAPSRGRWVSGLLGWAGVAGIAACAWFYSDTTVYPGVAALAPTTAAVAILAAGSWGQWGPAGLLALKPMQLIGRYSYSWYLWHWPVIVFTATVMTDPSWRVSAAAAGASLVPAALAYRIVENPLRRSAAVRSSPSAGLSLGLSAMVVPIAVFLVLGTSTVHAVDGGPVAGSASATGTGHGVVRPSLTEAVNDIPPSPLECLIEAKATTSPLCVIAPDMSSRQSVTGDRVVLLGDSHAVHWFSAIHSFAASRGLDTEVLGKAGCPLNRLTVVNPLLRRDYTECNTWRGSVLRRLDREPAPKAVFISTFAHYGDQTPKMLATWDPVVKRLQRLHVPIVYLADSPFPGFNVPECLSEHGGQENQCEFLRKVGPGTDLFADAIAAGDYRDFHVVDMRDEMCPRQSRTCPVVMDGVLLYRDESHLSDTGVRQFAPEVVRRIEALDVISSDRRDS